MKDFPAMRDALLQTAERLVSGLRVRDEISRVEFLDKGYSTDRKFLLWTDGEARYLLRLSPLSEVDRRRSDHDALSALHELGICCPRPITFGTSEEHDVCFILQTYISGECAEEVLPALEAEEQYSVGVQAGEELRRIQYSLTPPGPVDDFAARSGPFKQRCAQAAELGVDYPGRELAEKYMDRNMELLRNRPTTFRHGDFHPGNLILRDGKLAGVIDFNRCDWGDPIDDFYKLALFGAPVSESFACGQIRAYFGGEPPDSFWRLYNLYIAASLAGDVVWTHRYYPEQTSESLQRIRFIADTHDFRTGGPPSWWKD